MSRWNMRTGGGLCSRFTRKLIVTHLRALCGTPTSASLNSSSRSNEKTRTDCNALAAASFNGKLFLGTPVTWAYGIRDGIFDARLLKRAQAQRTTVTHATRNVLSLITRPGERQRRSQGQALLHDFALAHMDD